MKILKKTAGCLEKAYAVPAKQTGKFVRGLSGVPIVNTTINKLYKWYMGAVILLAPASLMADQGSSAIIGGLQKVLGVIFLIAFPWGVIVIWQGAMMKKKGDPDAHNSIIAGIWIAGGALIMASIYAAMGLGAGSKQMTPQFDFE